MVVWRKKGLHYKKIIYKIRVKSWRWALNRNSLTHPLKRQDQLQKSQRGTQEKELSGSKHFSLNKAHHHVLLPVIMQLLARLTLVDLAPEGSERPTIKSWLAG